MSKDEIDRRFQEMLLFYNMDCLYYWFDFDTGELKLEDGEYTQDDECGNGRAAPDSTKCPICSE